MDFVVNPCKFCSDNKYDSEPHIITKEATWVTNMTIVCSCGMQVSMNMPVDTSLSPIQKEDKLRALKGTLIEAWNKLNTI